MMHDPEMRSICLCGLIEIGLFTRVDDIRHEQITIYVFPTVVYGIFY